MCTFVRLLVGVWENVRDGCVAFLVFRVGSERILKGRGASPTVGAHGRQGLRDGRRGRRGVPLQRLIVSERGNGRVARGRGPALLLDVFGAEMYGL